MFRTSICMSGFALTLAFVLCPAGQEQKAPQPATTIGSAVIWARAGARLMAGDYDGAIADYTLILEKDPRSAQALIYRGDALYERGKQAAGKGDSQRMKEDYAASMADYDAAIAVDPNNADAFVSRCNLKMSQSDPEGAIDDCDEAIRLDPKYAVAYMLRANALWDQAEKGIANGEPVDRQKLEQALPDLTKMIELKASAGGYFQRALLYTALDQPQQALKDYDEAVRLDSRYSAAYINRGALRLASKDADGALQDFARAIELDSKDQDAYSQRAFAYESVGELDKAIEDYGQLLRLAPGDAGYRIRRGRVLARSRDFAGALADFTSATELEPLKGRGFAERAWLLATADDDRSRNGKQALEDAQRAVVFDGSGRSYEALAAAQAELGDYAAGVEALTKAEEADPGRNAELRASMRTQFQSGRPYRSPSVAADGQMTRSATLPPVVPPAASGDESQWIGKSFMATMDAVLAVGPNRRPATSDDLPLDVSKVQGDWLWVGDAWIAKSQAVPLQEAPAYYAAYLRTDPNSAEAYFRLGIAHATLERSAEAIEDFSAAIKLAPENLEAIGIRGNLRYERGDLEGAIEDYTLLLTKAPGNATALKFRGDAWLLKGDDARATADYDAAVAADAAFADAYVARGELKMDDFDLEGALADFDAAIRSEPAYAFAYHLRGDAQWALMHRDQALADYSKAIELDATRAVYFLERGELRNEMGDTAQALADFGEAVRLDPEFREAFVDRGKLNAKLKKLDEAAQDFGTAIRLDPQREEAYEERATVYEMQGDLDRAIADYATLIGFAPQQPGNYVERGLALFRQGKFALASEDFGQALRINPAQPFALAGRAWLRATADDPQFRDGKGALEDARLAVKGLASGRTLEALAAAQAEQADFAAASASLAKANELDPNGNATVRKAMQAAFDAGKPYRSPVER